MIWGETPYTLPGGRHANLEEKSDSPSTDKNQIKLNFWHRVPLTLGIGR